MKKDLYCCSSYYQVVVSLMKAMTEDRTIDLVLEEHGVPTGQELIRTIKENIPQVDRVLYCPDDTRVDPYRQYQASFWPAQRRAICKHVERVFGGVFDPSEYENLNIYWDLGYAGTYLNIRKIPYRLLEDSLNSYMHIKDNRPHYSYIFSPDRRKFNLKRKLQAGVIPFGYSPYCKEIEVNCKEDIQIPPGKVVEVPRAKLEEKLTEEQKKRIFRVFIPADGEAMSTIERSSGTDDSSSGNGENASVKTLSKALLLTEPFALTGRLPDEETQIRLYRDVLKQEAEGMQVYIKPHPRDTLDYAVFFPEAIVLEKAVPTEVLNYDPQFCFAKAVTVTSSAVQGILHAEEKVTLGADFWKKYKEIQV